MKPAFLIVSSFLLLTSCLTTDSSVSSFKMIIDEKEVTVQDNEAGNGIFLERPVTTQDLLGSWQLIYKEEYSRTNSSQYRLQLMDQDAYRKEMTRRWRGQGFKPAPETVEIKIDCTFTKDGKLIVYSHYFINGLPARQVTGKDYPWLWEFSEDNTQEMECSYTVNENTIELIYPKNYSYISRLDTRKEGDVTIHIQKLAWRQRGDTVYLYLGSEGLFTKIFD